MLTLREIAINNTFQIRDDLKSIETKRSFYQSSTKLRLSPKIQPPGEVKIFSEEEIFLYRVRKYEELCKKKEAISNG